jgi:ribosomal protein L12E/L44/L45/RPP1/RPP2
LRAGILFCRFIRVVVICFVYGLTWTFLYLRFHHGLPNKSGILRLYDEMTDPSVGRRIPANRRFSPRYLKALLKELEETNGQLSPQLREALEEELVAQTARADAARERAHEAKKRADEAKQRADEAEEKAARGADLFAMQGLFLSGEYYTPLERVWRSGTAGYGDEALFEALRREIALTIPDRQRLQSNGTPDSYAVTLQEATVTRLGWSAVHCSSVDTEEEIAPWPINIFGGKAFGSHWTHLVPVCDERASMYSDVARCVLALRDDAQINIC